MKKRLVLFVSVCLVVAGLALTACGDVDNNSTKVSSDVRPAAPITAAQQNNNAGTGLPTDPTKSAVQAGGATATAMAPTATTGSNSSGNTAGGQGGGNTSGQTTTQAAGGTTAASGSGGNSSGGGDATKGLATFKSAGCSGCHSNLGKAAGGVGPKLAGTSRDDAYIKNIIRNGKGAMPAHSTDEVSDADITNLIAYIRSLK